MAAYQTCRRTRRQLANTSARNRRGVGVIVAAARRGLGSRRRRVSRCPFRHPVSKAAGIGERKQVGEYAMMTRVVGVLAATVLFGLGALHVYWAGGGRWGTRRRHTEARRSGALHTRPGGHTAGRRASLRGGARAARAPRRLGTRSSALAVRDWHVGARRGVRRARRRRPPMVRALQADDRNTVRVVGHLGLRPAVRAARSGGPDRWVSRALTTAARLALDAEVAKQALWSRCPCACS